MTTILLKGPVGSPLWCKPRGKDGAGNQVIDVINGEWRGSMDPKGFIHIEGMGGRSGPYQEVWRGKVPRSETVDYMDAIEWITKQIASENTP